MTDFGDAAVLIPLAAVMLLWLLLGNLRSAAWWAVSVGCFVGLTALLKIFFYGCPPASDIRSPSGHTGFSVLVYGAIALVTTIQARGVRRALAVGIGTGLILMIAASRLLLEIHSLPEVSLGLVIGMVSLVLFGRIYLQSPQTQVWQLLVAAGMLVSILHGQELHAEEFLHRITGYLRVHCS
ncbi:MAG TPA: phosphatase PAP2 family protein [Terracidiphilus sp.]